MSEDTRVLYRGEPLRRAAVKMMPKLAEDRFVQAVDIEEAAREAAADGIGQLILFAEPGTLDDAGLDLPLAEITTEMGGTGDLAAEVTEGGTVRAAYGTWHAAATLHEVRPDSPYPRDLVGRCGRELCRRVADRLEEIAGGAVAVQVVLLAPAAGRMVGMYGRLRR
ncbi:hypothetical protein [Spirillospora sp. NPDC029432]|uniref:hypothetical protein n=1 Tax=Spirillospora sp. NPDC029432 TaxID=3154599 RepID=UPI003453EC77